MAKDTCDGSKRMPLSFLKQEGYLRPLNYRSGSIQWNIRGEPTGSMGIVVSTMPDDRYVRLIYTNTSRQTGEKSELDYRVQLVTTPCHFGGARYWYLCPLMVNGVTCNRRVGVLYINGKYAGCRHCYDLAYYSQQKTHTGTWSVLGKFLDSDLVYEKISNLRVKYWKGRPTKRHARLLRKIGSQDIDALNDALDILEGRSQK